MLLPSRGTLCSISSSHSPASPYNLPLLLTPHCINFPLLCERIPQSLRLKTTYFYYLPVSLGQEAGHSFFDLPHKGLHSCSYGPADCVLIWRLGWGRIHLQAYLGCWQNSFPVAAVLKASCWLSAGAILSSERLLVVPEVPGATHSSLPLGLSQYGLLIHSDIKQSKSASSLR